MKTTLALLTALLFAAPDAPHAAEAKPAAET